MSEYSWLFGAIGTLLGIIISYAAFLRNSKKDSSDEGRETGQVLTEIGYIKANTDEIKAEQRRQQETNIQLITRLTAVESSTKQAHKRLDRIEGLGEREVSHE